VRGVRAWVWARNGWTSGMSGAVLDRAIKAPYPWAARRVWSPLPAPVDLSPCPAVSPRVPSRAQSFAAAHYGSVFILRALYCVLYRDSLEPFPATAEYPPRPPLLRPFLVL
jgi:hypothetical protein